MSDRAATIAKAGLRALDLGEPEKFLSRFIGGNFEIEFIIHPMDREETPLRFGILRDDFVVGLDWVGLLLLVRLFDIVRSRSVCGFRGLRLFGFWNLAFAMSR